MHNVADILPQPLNLEAAAILDFDRGEISGIATDLNRPDKAERMFRGVHLKYLEAEKVFRKLFTQTTVDPQLDVAALRQIHSFS
jgi:hypothetical protein